MKLEKKSPQILNSTADIDTEFATTADFFWRGKDILGKRGRALKQPTPYFKRFTKLKTSFGNHRTSGKDIKER